MKKSEVDLSDAAPTDLLALTEAALSVWAKVEPLESCRLSPLRWRMWQFGDLVLSESHFGGMRLVRSGSDFPQYDNEYLLIEIYETGWSRANVDEQRVCHQTGSVYLLDMSREFQTVANGVKTRGLLIPHARVGYDPSVHAAVMTLPKASHHGRLLAHTVWTLLDRIEHVDDAEATKLGQQVVNVVRALMFDPTTRANGQDVRNARRLAMESFIETQLSDSQLGIDLLCQRFGVSRATLYRHFPEAGGVAAYVRARRLAAAYRDLRGSNLTKGRIRSVSEHWGFTDSGHFHRLFKREFKVSPSDAAGSAFEPNATMIAPSKLLEDWTDTLRG